MPDKKTLCITEGITTSEEMVTVVEEGVIDILYNHNIHALLIINIFGLHKLENHEESFSPFFLVSKF